MPRLLIVQPGQKLTALDGVAGDFGDWVAQGLGIAPADAPIVRIDLGEPLPVLDGASAVVVTGSAAMVTDAAPWMAPTAAWLRRAHERRIPILGICFGHQLLAWALGGRVAYNPRGVEVGTVEVELSAAACQDPLFGGLSGPLKLHVSHRQSVVELPPGAVHLARSRMEPNHAFVIDGHAWGVQFHPEFTAPVVAGYIEHYRAMLKEQGEDAERLHRSVTDEGPGPYILRRFAALAGLGSKRTGSGDLSALQGDPQIRRSHRD